MCRSQSFGNASADVHDLFQRKSAIRNELAQRLAPDQLHDEPGFSIVRREIVNGDDVRMIQSRGAARFTLEPSDPGRIATDLLRQDLDGHVPAEPSVAGA